MTESTARSPALDDLRRLARNLWWCWDAEALRLFEELSPAAWQECRHNPTALLSRLSPDEVESKCAEGGFRQRLQRTLERLQAYLAVPERPDQKELPSRARPVAYFCAEYGFHESMPLYSGGLGVLAGDHLKSASDLAIPLVAVGLFYRGGYMHQGIDDQGRQTVIELPNDPELLRLESVVDDQGDPVEVIVPLAEQELTLRAWRAEIGRVTLYLLDSDVPANADDLRRVTRRLYGGAAEMRIRQELVLGCGGVRLLDRLAIRPSVWHMNEGHAAFLTVERAGQLVAAGLAFDAVRAQVSSTTLFTTHTPVPAGHDKFDTKLAQRYLSGFAQRLGLSWGDFAVLGRSDDQPDQFNMTMLALRMSSYCNGVSQLHGAVSRQLLANAWPGVPVDDVPITAITNGIHLATWTNPGLTEALGAVGRPARGEDFERHADGLDPVELWRTKQPLRRRVLEAVRASTEQRRAPLPPDALDERSLLIGFARRFATYKRANLLLREPDRLARLLGDPERPVRLIVAGKAHPRDERGKELLARIVDAGRGALRGRILFLEDYGMELARTLVQGVDLWLNNPRRLQEASGTSGMKAAANGALNLSIADGWWPEAADGENGWTIEKARTHDDDEAQDAVDAEALYRCLEDEVRPLFFRRDENDVPLEWLRRVRHVLTTIPPVFNTDRMVRQYLDQAYRPLSRNAKP